MTVIVRTIGGIDATLDGLVETTVDWGTIRGRARARSNAAFERSVAGGRYTGSTYPVDQITLTHRIIAPVGQREDTLEVLRGTWYEPFTPAPGDDEVELVYEEGGIEKVIRVVPAGFGEHADNSGPTGEENWWYQGTWNVYDPVAYAVEETETAGTSPTVTVAVRGISTSRRVSYELTPGAAKAAADGQRYRRLITIANRSARPWVRWPLLLTPGGINHAALTPADSQGTGYDVEGYAAARRVPVWSDNWDEAMTLVWRSADMPAGRYWTVRAAASSGATEIEILEPLANLPGATFHAMSESGNVWLVAAADTDTGTWTVEGARRDTSAEALVAGQRLWWVAPAGLVDLAYGGTSLPDPAYDAREKPIIDLEASDNTGFDYAAYYEPIAAENIAARHPRAGSLTLRSLGTYDREFYTGGNQYWRTVPSDAGEPATFFGLDYRADGPISGRPLADRWDLESPVGMTSISFKWTAYTKYSASGGGSIKRGRLLVVMIDGDGNEIIGGRYDTEVTGGSGTVTLSPSVPVYAASWRWEPYDRQLAPDDGAALEPADGPVWKIEDLEVGFDSSESPLVAFGATVHDIYQFGRPDAPAYLSTPAATLAIRGAIVDLDETLVVDAEARSVGVVDGAAFGHLTRGEIPPLPADMTSYPSAGSVDVDFTDDGDPGVALVVRHRDAW